MSDVWLVLIGLFGLIALGVPVPIAMGAATAGGFFLIDVPLVAVAQNAYNGLESTPLATIPLFILAGALMQRGGITDRIIGVSQALVGGYRGSLAMVAILACTFFAALSGSGPATTAAIGAVTIPAMLQARYRPAFAGVVNAAGGALGSLIPPSNLMVIYAILTNVSIAKIFLAGIIPGLIASALLMLVAWLVATRYGYGEAGQPFSMNTLLRAIADGKWAIGAPMIILGGIYMGIFTATEAAAVAVAYAVAVGLFVYRVLDLDGVIDSLRFTAVVSGSVLILLGLARGFGEVMTLMGAPSLVGDWLTRISGQPSVVLLIIIVVFLVTGTFMESAAQVILFVPLFLPVVTQLGIDPIVFGVIVVCTCEIGFLTPPVGANLFVAMRIANCSLEEVSVAALPFLLPYLIVIALLCFLPDIALLLPRLAFGG